MYDQSTWLEIPTAKVPYVRTQGKKTKFFESQNQKKTFIFLDPLRSLDKKLKLIIQYSYLFVLSLVLLVQ